MLRTNILVLGKSGAGKSSLLNYLWGDVIAKTGVGRPVTERSTDDEIGIYQSQPIKVDKLEIVIYDSWGMEADKADEWNEIIRRESQKREESSNIEDWFHAVIYCVSAKGARIEAFEIEQVVQPLLDAGHSVIFALTKCGVASDEERLRVREAIEQACPNHGGIVEVESVPVQLRGRATPTQTSGKDRLLEAAKDNFVANLGHKLQAKYLARCDDQLETWKYRVLRLYDDKASFIKPTAMTLNEVAEGAIRWLDECLASLDEWRESREKQASDFYRAFGSVLLQKTPVVGHKFLSRNKPLTRANLEWSGFDHATSFVMNFLPGINILYWVVRKDVHKDFLADKLRDAVAAIKEQARNGLARQAEFDSLVEKLSSARDMLAQAMEAMTSD